MAWSIEVSTGAEGELRRLDSVAAKRLTSYLNSLVSVISNPRERSKALTVPYSGLWRYRVGDYRIICQLQDERLVILVLRFAHRSDVYR